VEVNDHRIKALDTGSDISIMREVFYHRTGTSLLTNRPIKFHGIVPEENGTLGKTQVKICINKCLYEVTFHIVPNSYISCDMLIGSDFLENVVVKIEEDVITNTSIPEQNSD